MGELMRDDRSADQIRRDIEGTRSDLHATIDALERRLSVGQVVDELWNRVGGRRSIGSAASGLGDSLREHPVPLALMGLGVAWLAVERSTAGRSRKTNGETWDRWDREYVGAGTYAPAEGRVGPYGPDAIHGEGFPSHEQGMLSSHEHEHEESGPGLGERASSAVGKAKSKVSDAMETVKEKASDVADTGKRKTRDARERAAASAEGVRERMSREGEGFRARAGDRLEEGRDRMRHGVRAGSDRVRRGFRDALEEQPLAMGAVAFGLGLASGLSVPTTRFEDRTMGEASDQVTKQAKRAARETVEDVKDVAGAAASAAREEADRRHPVGEIVDSGKSIAREAKRAAEERAREKDLDSEGMKDRLGEVGERMRDTRGEGRTSSSEPTRESSGGETRSSSEHEGSRQGQSRPGDGHARRSDSQARPGESWTEPGSPPHESRSRPEQGGEPGKRR